MITAKQIADALGYPTEYRVGLSIIGGSVTLVDTGDGESFIKPWHQTYAQACWDAQAILPYDEAKAEQLYNWQQADVPLSVSKPKFFVALYRSHGKKLSDITAVIEGIQDPDARYEAEIELAESAEVQRDNPLIEMIGKGVWELTDTEINDVFKLAKSLAET